MEAFLAFWWIAPAAVAAGAAAWIGLRVSRSEGRRAMTPMPRGAARRLGLNAALHELESAKTDAARARAQLRVARADLLRVEADRAALRARDGAVATARRRVQSARTELKAAGIAVRARRAAVGAARASVPTGHADRADFPLGRLMAEHDALTGRWMQYETDPAKLIEYPTMSDARSPLLTAFLDAERQARWLRPASVDARTTPADFAAYRTAVRHAEDAFDAAEREALIKAGHRPPPQWTVKAESWFEHAQDVITATQRTVEWSIKNFPRRDSRPPSS